jgi:hypothetical protein
VRDLPNLTKSKMIFGSFPHLVNSFLHQYIRVFELNHLLS